MVTHSLTLKTNQINPACIQNKGQNNNTIIRLHSNDPIRPRGGNRSTKSRKKPQNARMCCHVAVFPEVFSFFVDPLCCVRLFLASDARVHSHRTNRQCKPLYPQVGTLHTSRFVSPDPNTAKTSPRRICTQE